MSDHGGLVTVQCDGGVVERLFGVFQYVVQVRDPALKYTPEVPRHQGTTNGVSFGAVLQVEGEGQAGIVLKELGGKSIPPQIVTLLTPLL